MKRLISKTQTGIGLIEVLITTVVVAVGLVAIVSLQTDLLSGSGESKIRSEARALAERRIEQLRNSINLTGYNAIAAGATTESDISGTNATFTRTTTITDAASFMASSANRKNISVQVSWGEGADERVNVITEMAWADPSDSALFANENGSPSPSTIPSPRQNASEDVASEDVDANTPTPLPGIVTATLDQGALPSSISVTGDDGATYLLTPITTELPATHFYSTSFGEGIIAVFLCEDNGQCKYIQNHFGGVALRIAGTVYSTSNNDFNNITVAWTSSDVNACYNGPITGTTLKQRPYECVFAGNCNATDSVPGSYCSDDVSDEQIDSRDVGPGGEYGDVGLLGVVDQGGGEEQVCFLEDTTDPEHSILIQASGNEVLNEDYLYATSKRFYAARKIKRNGSINEQVSEGINRSYTNHNFLVIDRGSGGDANEECHEEAVDHSIVLAPREIIRPLDQSTSNAVSAASAYAGAAGTAKTYTGSITSNATKLRLYIEETGSCYLNNNDANSNTDATAYACAVASNATGVVIKGGSNQHPTSSPAVFRSCTKTTDSTACNWPGNF
jgi:Tfp pilus assembly protein PilV